METTLQNPRLPKVNAELTLLADLANAGCSARTATLQLTSQQFRKPASSWRSGGESVANSYKYRCEMTLVSVAWFRDADGVRHVRIQAYRGNASKSSHGHSQRGAFGMTDKQWRSCKTDELVYPWLAQVREHASEFTLDSDGRLCPTALLIAADYLDENGHADLAAKLRETFGCIHKFDGSRAVSV